MSLLGDLGTAIKNKLGGASVDNTVPRYNGTTCTLQSSEVTISDTNVVTASGGFVGNLTGNATTATTATKLAIARTINGVSFDGTANITIADDTKVPLNGTGASGTWNINITGNAGSATNASTLNGYSGAHYLLQDSWDYSPGKDANLQEGMRVDFTYGNNAPFTGPLMNVGVNNYSMQFNGLYSGGSNLAYRTKNGDSNTWNPWRYIAFTDSNITGNAATATIATNAGYATTAGRAYPRRSDGADLNFYWSGQGGQPTWLWGGNDGANMYVYNPSNFSVNYANSAGSVSASAVASGTAGIGTGGIGSYAFMNLVGAYNTAVGSTTAGSNLRYSCVNGSSVGDSPTAPSGTWRAMGNGGYNYLTLWLRIA